MANVNDKPRFISFHRDDTGTRTVPIATGHDYKECQALAITRTLSCCELTGTIHTQDRTADVDLTTFIRITEFLNAHFMSIDAAVRGNAS